MCFILDSLYCYVFSAQIFPSVTFNLLLPSLSVIFFVHKVFISRSILSMCLLVFLNIWNNCNCFSVFVYYFYHISVSFDWLMILLLICPVFLLLCMPNPLRYLSVKKDHKERLEGTQCLTFTRGSNSACLHQPD